MGRKMALDMLFKAVFLLNKNLRIKIFTFPAGCVMIKNI